MKCINCVWFCNVSSDANRAYGKCEYSDVILAPEKDDFCGYYLDKEDVERKHREAEEKLWRIKEIAKEYIAIMDTWRDRVNPIVLDFAIDAIKKSWGIR